MLTWDILLWPGRAALEADCQHQFDRLSSTSMSTTHITSGSHLKDAYQRVMDRVGDAAIRRGRERQDVIVVAVTKMASPDQLHTLVDIGHVDFGENRVQQLVQRGPQLEEFINRKQFLGRAVELRAEPVPEVRWHMIGHLQRNKVKLVLSQVKLIHSADSLRLVEEIQNFAVRQESPVEVLLQVNTSGETGKQGIAPPAAIHMAEQIHGMINLKLRGLMTIAPINDAAEASRSHFTRTYEIYKEIQSEGNCGDHFNILSMGMSNDFEIAIEEGANMVRIGRAIFGEG